jgi:hypothetical protein
MYRVKPPAGLRTLLLAAGFSAVLAASAHATIVPGVGLDQMIADAELIVRARVAEIEPRWADDRSTIYTYVTFTDVSVVRGQLFGPLTLRFEGGQVGGRRLQVDGMPAFRKGDEEILFVRGNGVSASPVLGVFQGRFKVVEGRVYDYAGTPLLGISDGTLVKLADDAPAAAQGGIRLGTAGTAEYEYTENPDRDRIEAALVAAAVADHRNRLPRSAPNKGSGVGRGGSPDQAVAPPVAVSAAGIRAAAAPKPDALYVTRSQDTGQRLTADAFIGVIRARSSAR